MKQIISQEISRLTNLDESKIFSSIEIPPSTDLGDYAFPCFSLSKELKKNPIEIARDLASKIKLTEFERVEAKGPYINFFLNKESNAHKVLSKILSTKSKFGSSKKTSEKIMVEFSQANTHKAFHVGHIRGTSIGESISRILEFTGNSVTRVNYQGDTGMHVAKWIWCYTKYHDGEKIQKDESWIASIYVEAVKNLDANPELQSEVDIINQKLELGKDKKLMALWEKSRIICLEALGKIYKELNTRFDRLYFEREVESEGKKIALDLVKKGIAKISEGATIMDLKDLGLSVWVLLRKDNTVLYSAKDLALAQKKFKEFDLDRSINIVADEQNLHFMQLFKTLELMKFKDISKCKHIPFALVRLPEGKMSSRTGQNILYSDFMKELINYSKEEINKREKLSDKELTERALKISIAAIKYSFIKQHSNNVIVFNKEEALNFEGNTGPYLLYSYARANSILKKAKSKGEKKFEVKSVNLKENAIVNKLAIFPQIVSHSAESLSPNLIANYTFELAQMFNEFYHAEQVIGSENEEFRLAIVNSFLIVLENALTLLGIDVLKKM